MRVKVGDRAIEVPPARPGPAMDSDLDAKLFAAALHAITHIWGREMGELQRASLAGEIVREIDRRKIVASDADGFASQVWGLSILALAELDDGDTNGAQKTLVKIAEAAAAAMSPAKTA